MLSHLGMQREGRDVRRRVDAHRGSRSRFAEPHRAHLSNLAFGLLGRVVSAKRGAHKEFVDERIIRPLGPSGRRGTRAPHAQGYLVDEHAGNV
jgi:hypothetical protein